MSSRHSTSSSNGGASAAGSGWAGARHTIFLRVHSANKLQFSTSQASYCKIYIGDTPVVTSTTNMSNLLNDKPLPDHRAFHTKVTNSKLKTTAMWNQKFEVPVDNIKKQILSIRVKSQHQLYSPSIGSCAIPLKQLKTNTTIDQNFPLFKGSTQCGTIRLQLMIRDNQPGREDSEGPVKEAKTAKRATSEHDPSWHDRRAQAVLEDEERQRQHREKLEQEKRRIEQEMEKLRIEEEEHARRKFEEEERRILEEERLAFERAEKEREKEEKRRRKAQQQLEEDELAKKLLAESMMRKKTKSMSSDNQSENLDNKSRTSSSMTVLMSDDHDGSLSDMEGKPLRGSSKSTPAMKMRRSSIESRRRHSTMSLRDVIDEVVQDALPSDSDSDASDELDTEDEHEFVRKMAKLKLKLLKRKKLRQSMSIENNRDRRSSLVLDQDKSKSKSKKHRKSSMSSSDSSSSSSSSSSSDNEQHARKSKKKHAKAKQQPQYSSSDDEDQKRKSQMKKTKDKSKNKPNDGLIKVLTPGQISKKTGSGHSDQLSMGQVMEAAMNVANLAVADDDVEFSAETVADTVDTLQSLAPIGRFIGRKIHEASARVAQMKEKEQPTYYF